MSDSCSSGCDGDSCAPTAKNARQRRVLQIVLAVNATMFAVEASAGWLANSSALLADSLDMLGDSIAYGFSLYVIGRGARWTAISALLKGLLMAAFGLFVLGSVIYKLLWPVLPHAETISLIGALALAANLFCLLLLWRHRSDDINMHSVWLCSRNDIIANTGVIAAGFGVALSHSGWPDIAIGLLIASLFLRSATQVLLRAFRQLKANPA